MKYALLYDDDAAARRHSATLLKSLGYIVAETTTANFFTLFKKAQRPHS